MYPNIELGHEHDSHCSWGCDWPTALLIDYFHTSDCSYPKWSDWPQYSLQHTYSWLLYSAIKAEAWHDHLEYNQTTISFTGRRSKTFVVFKALSLSPSLCLLQYSRRSTEFSTFCGEIFKWIRCKFVIIINNIISWITNNARHSSTCDMVLLFNISPPV